MSDKVFLDSNILVYLYSFDEPKKKEIAECIITENNCLISTQGINEFINVLRRKKKKEYKEISLCIKEILDFSHLCYLDEETILHAMSIGEKYKFSYFDSLMISSALQADCSILYSEDLHHNQIIKKKVKVVNPFKA